MALISPCSLCAVDNCFISINGFSIASTSDDFMALIGMSPKIGNAILSSLDVFFFCVSGFVKCSIDSSHCLVISAKLFIIGRPSVTRSLFDCTSCLALFFSILISLGSIPFATLSLASSDLRLAASKVSGQRRPKPPSAHRTVRTDPYTAPHARLIH